MRIKVLPYTSVYRILVNLDRDTKDEHKPTLGPRKSIEWALHGSVPPQRRRRPVRVSLEPEPEKFTIEGES